MSKVFVSQLSVLFAVAMLSGCADSQPRQDAGSSTTTQVASNEHTHGEWWCIEHGMPEEVCAQCSTELAAEFKAKGDWCQEHDRPDSQCFACHPELEQKFAAQYEAKYGTAPPKPTAEEGAHDHEHDHDHDHAEESQS